MEETTASWNATPCIMVENYQCFVRTSCIHTQYLLPTQCTVLLLLLFIAPTCFGHSSRPASGSS